MAIDDYYDPPLGGPAEDVMDLNVRFRRIPKSKAREICGDIAGIWDPRYYITISITRSED